MEGRTGASLAPKGESRGTHSSLLAPKRSVSKRDREEHGLPPEVQATAPLHRSCIQERACAFPQRGRGNVHPFLAPPSKRRRAWLSSRRKRQGALLHPSSLHSSLHVQDSLREAIRDSIRIFLVERTGTALTSPTYQEGEGWKEEAGGGLPPT